MGKIRSGERDKGRMQENNFPLTMEEYREMSLISRQKDLMRQMQNLCFYYLMFLNKKLFTLSLGCRVTASV